MSETFIAQEILELERRGVDACVFALDENDMPARHAWLNSLCAEVVACPPGTLRDTWEWQHARLAESTPLGGRGVRRALTWALEAEKGRRDLAQAVTLVKAAEMRGIDRLHAHFANRPAFVSLLANSLGGLPFSVTAHAKDIFATGPPLAVWRRIARRADFIATVSESNRRHLLELVGTRWSHKIQRLYNGVDLEAIQPKPQTTDPGPLRLLCVARLVPKKGLCDLVEALGGLRARGVRFTCSIAGEGPERESLRSLIDARSLADCVELAGSLPHETVIAMLAKSDAVVLPCRVLEDGDRDVLPTVLLEAMAAGVPCVSTTVGGIPEIVSHGETGLLVPDRDPTALAAALQVLAEDPALAARMGAAGRRRAEKCFDRRRTVARLHQCFEAGVSEAAEQSSTTPAQRLAAAG